jgi:hypothetical protein
VVVDGLAETRDPVLRACYRRWHSWAVSYLAGLELWSEGQPGRAFTAVFAGLGRDPLLTARVLPQAVRHLVERQARRGHPSLEEANSITWRRRMTPIGANAISSDSGLPPLQ